MGGCQLVPGRTRRPWPRPPLSRWTAGLLAASLVIAALPTPAGAVEPPPEVRHVCVDQQSNVHQADGPGACTSNERVFTLPVDRPFHMCADSLGRLKHVASTGRCGARETLLTVPDSGPLFVCSQNLRGGTRLARGALRYVADVSRCDRDETAFVTPAAPTAFDDTYTIDEDTLLDVPARGVLDNDRDLTGAPLRATLVTDVARGSLTLATDGGLRFDPRGAFDSLDGGQSATTTFTYVANDGALDSRPATVTVRITGRNDRPVAANDAYGTDEDTVVSVVAPGLLANDTDAEGHRLTANLVSGPDRGVLTLNADGSFRFAPAGAYEALDAGQRASAAFTYRATDGTDTSDTATAVVTVEGVNDAPVARPDAATTDENTPLVITRSSLLANDTDAEGHALEIRDADVSPPDRGSLEVSAGQPLVFDPRAAFDALGAGQTATATFTYRAAETGGGAVSAPVPVVVTVTGVAPPDAVDDTARTSEDAAVEVDLFANDRLNGGRLVGISSTSGGGAVTATATPGVVRYDPGAAHQDLDAGESRADTFSYTLQRDGEAPDSAVVTIIVEGRNDAPSAADDSYTLASPHRAESRPATSGVLANDSDVDGEPLAARLVSPPKLGRLTLGTDGGFTFDPAGELPDAGANVTFAYRATDGSAESRTATVTLNVGTNVLPVFDSPSLSLRMVTDDGDGIVGRVSASDADNDVPLTFRFTDPATAPFAIDPDGTIRFASVPVPGTYSRSVQVQDARGGTTTASVVIEVDAPLRAAPDSFRAIGNTELVAGGPTAAAAARGTVVASVAQGLLANDGGTQGEPVSVEAFTGDSVRGGHVDVFADGSFVYLPPRPDPDGSVWDGTVPFVDSFTYRLLRHEGEAELADVTLTVTDVVWYVDASAPAPGTGTAIAPYEALSSLTPADPAADDDGAGHVIFLRGGAAGLAYPDAVVLENGQSLVGEGAGLSFDAEGPFAAYALVPPGQEPSLTAQAGTSAVVLAADNTVKGLRVDSGVAGILGGAVGDLQLAASTVAASGGPALDLAGGSQAARVAVTALRSTTTPGGHGIGLRQMDGIVSFGTVDLTAATGLAISGSAATVSVSTLDARGGTVAAQFVETSGTVFVGELRASASGVAALVTRTSGAVRIGKVVQAPGGLAAGATISANTGSVTIDDVDLPAVTSHGVRVQASAGPVRVGRGRLAADAGTFRGVLLDVSGARSTVNVGAALSLSSASGPPAQRPGGRSVLVRDLDGAGAVSFTGTVVDHGAGIELSGNAGSGVRFSGGMRLDTGEHVSFYALSGGVVEVGGSAQNVLSAAGATALRLAGATIGTGGIRFDEVTSTDAPHVATDLKATGSGIDVNAVSTLASAPSARLVVVAGRVERAATSAVRVTGSRNVTIGNVSAVESGAEGVRTAGNRNLVLEGTTVDRSGGDGIASADDRSLVLDGASVVSSKGRGVAVAGVAEALTMRNSSVRRSLSTQVEVVDTGTDPSVRDVILLEGTSVGDGIEEQANVVVRSSGGSRLTLRSAGATPSSIVGGGPGLKATASDGGDLAVEVTNFLVARTGGDGIRLASSDERSSIDVASTVRVDVHDLAGVQATAGNGIVLETDGTGTMSGTVARVDLGGSEASAVTARRVAGVNLSQVRVTGSTGPGVLLDRSSSMRLDRVEVTGPPQAHGIELRNTRDITILDSRVDLRGPVPEIPQDPLPPPYQEPCRSVHDVRGVNPVPDQPRRAGIFARHVGGQLSVTNTTVRGATLHQIVALNGPSFPDPEIDDPAPAIETDGQLSLSGLTLLDTPDGRNGLLAGAGTAGRLKVELSGARPISTDAPLLVCAVDGGQVAGTGSGEPGVTGGPVISVTGPGDALVLKAAGAETISPPPSFPFPTPRTVVNRAFLHFLLDGLSVDFDAPDAAGRALVAVSELYGIVRGSITNTTVTDAPGEGLELRGVSGVLVDGIHVVRSQGDGVVVAGSDQVELRAIVVEQPAGAGLVIDRSSDVVVGDVTIVEPAAGGIVATSSQRLTLRAIDVTRPGRHAVELRDVHTPTVEDVTADFVADADTPAPSAPASAVAARHVGGAVRLNDVRSTGATAHPISIVNGSSFPGVADLPGGGAVEADAALVLSDLHTEGTVAGSDAVLVGAGPGGTVDVNLDGAASTLDGRFRLEAAGGTLTVTGGHALTRDGPGDALAIVAPASVDLAGMSVDFHPDVAAADRGAGIRVTGGEATVITGSNVVGAGIGVAVEGADAATITGTSITGSRDTGVSAVTKKVEMTDVVVDGAGGTAVVVRTATAATLTGTVARNAGAGIDLTGVGTASLTRSSVRSIGGTGVLVRQGAGPLCADLVDSDVAETTGVNFDLLDAGLRDFRSSGHATETVEEWLMRKQNRTVDSAEVGSSDVRPC